MKEIIEIINKDLEELQKQMKIWEGGQQEFLETLQDSDMFYNEASTDGGISTLEGILKKIEELNTNTAEVAKEHIKLYKDELEPRAYELYKNMSNAILKNENLEDEHIVFITVKETV